MSDYPPPAPITVTPIVPLDPRYQDQAAVKLYQEAAGAKLVGALRALHQTILSQSAKLDEYPNTPFSENHARLISTTVQAIEQLERQVERWHHLMYPNSDGRGAMQQRQ